MVLLVVSTRERCAPTCSLLPQIECVCLQPVVCVRGWPLAASEPCHHTTCCGLSGARGECRVRVLPGPSTLLQAHRRPLLRVQPLLLVPLAAAPLGAP